MIKILEEVKKFRVIFTKFIRDRPNVSKKMLEHSKKIF